MKPKLALYKLLATLLALTIPAAALALDYTYTIADGKVTITGYTGIGGDITIPDLIAGLPVTVIGEYAFEEQTSLTSVTISDGVTHIRDSAFEYCTNLITVTLPDSVTNIGEAAFYQCPSLASAIIGNSISRIEHSAFEGCTSLDSLTIPDSATYIGIYAFHSCSNLTAITIPASVTSIGDEAFQGCTSLTSINVVALNSAYTSVDGVLFNKSVTILLQYPGGKTGSYTIPGTVTDIGSYRGLQPFAFSTSLTSVTIPFGISEITHRTFQGCTSLISINVVALNPTYASADGVVFNKSQTKLITCPGGKTGHYTIPSSVTVIEDAALRGCTSLISVSIPGSVTSIGSTGLITIGQVFYGCTSLTSINVDLLNTTYSSVDGVLFNKIQTELITCPGGRTDSYSIPDNVTKIGKDAFAYCTSLASITVPDSVTTISAHFTYCTSLTSIYFLGNAPYISSFGSVFNGTPDAIIYYLPGSTGWGATFGGRPTVLWNPLVPTNGAGIGLQGGQFGFTITSPNDLVVVVETSESLISPIWTPASTNIITMGSSFFSDSQWTNYPSRFYRLSMP